jgi:hypothetical protein
LALPASTRARFGLDFVFKVFFCLFCIWADTN